MVLLVTITDNGNIENLCSSTVLLLASASDSAISVEPETIVTDEFVEIGVILAIAAVGGDITMIITAERAGLVQTKLNNFTFLEGDNFRVERTIEQKRRGPCYYASLIDSKVETADHMVTLPKDGTLGF